jgi:aldose 1-epimerase
MIKLKQNNMEAVVSEDGCYIVSLSCNGNEVFKVSADGHKTHGGCAPLFPFANRIKSGKYIWDNKEYELKKDSDGNAIHGFAKDVLWTIEDKNEDSVTLKTNLYCEEYPFDIDTLVSICISENRFCETARFINKAERSAPLSPGFHPYFIVGNNWEINVENRPLKVIKEDNFFPSGNFSEFYKHFYKKSSHRFDDCFKYSGNIKISGDYTRYNMDITNAKYFMVYDGQYAEQKSVAVEPMSSSINSFNTGVDLKILNPGEVWPFGFSFNIQSI